VPVCWETVTIGNLWVWFCIVSVLMTCGSCSTDDDDESPDKYAYNARAGEGQYCG